MPSTRRHQSSEEVAALMEDWPKSWAGTREDTPVGRRLVAVLQLFMAHPQQQELAPSTRRRHLDNLWLIGGEIIRRVNDEPALRKQPARALLLDAVLGGEPLLLHDTEEQQRAVDATARKLLKFLSAPNRRPGT